MCCNRAERAATEAAIRCALSQSRFGFNVTFASCTNCAFTNSVSRKALCGSALEWTGPDARIVANVFRGNGENAVDGLWSDGLTLLESNAALVAYNHFANNSDVSFVSGGGPNSRYSNNTIEQSGQRVFAGLMLARFSNTTSGDFRGTLVGGAVGERNNISCAHLCHIGIQLGGHPWDEAEAQTIGGTIQNNSVTDAGILGINLDGAGTDADPVTLDNNEATGTPPTKPFQFHNPACTAPGTSNFNLFADHVRAVRLGGLPPETGFRVHNCF